MLPGTYQAAGPPADPEAPIDILWGPGGPPEGWEDPYGDIVPPSDEIWNAQGDLPAEASEPASSEIAGLSPIFFEARRTGLRAAPAADGATGSLRARRPAARRAPICRRFQIMCCWQAR